MNFSFTHKLYLVFFTSIIIIFFCFRPLNSSWYRIITADGLGYYAYLPAQFIYEDDHLEFKWFNEVYNHYYNYNSFNTPDENFMTQFGDKRINKYYPGLSFLWLPFFITTHFVCKIFHFHADGFSLPYQLAIGIAALVYACIGLWYLRKLIFKLVNNEFIANSIPIIIFFGTNLFNYTIYVGTFSHVYSFTFITIAYYYSYEYFNSDSNKLRNFIYLIACTIIIVFIRPLNALFLLSIPFFVNHYRKTSFKVEMERISIRTWFAILVMISLLIYQCRILFIQTGSYMPNTYSNEKFHFERPSHFLEVLFSYNSGWFVYVPLAFFALLSIFLINKKPKIVFLIAFLVLIIFIYSNWWYYAVISRAIVDYTAMVAILLALIMQSLLHKKALKIIFLTILIFSASYYQLKAFQLRNHILDPNYTYKEYFWRDFFTLKPQPIFPIPPRTILKNSALNEGFENHSSKFLSKHEKHSGNYSIELSASNHFSDAFLLNYPSYYNVSGVKKVKISFWSKYSDDIGILQILCKSYSSKPDIKQEKTFYIELKQQCKDKWNYSEYGFDVAPNIQPNDSLELFFWNVEGYNRIFIDDVIIEFFLTDDSMEMIP